MLALESKNQVLLKEHSSETATDFAESDSPSPSLLSVHEGRSKKACFNGLLVVPDTKTIRDVYLCNETWEDLVLENNLDVEKRLRGEIFDVMKDSSTNTDTIPQDRGEQQLHDDQEQAPFKMSCATCLLDLEPNGFACVSSAQRELVDGARQNAMARAKERRENGDSNLHDDHADACLCLPRQALEDLLEAKTRSRTLQAQDAILEHFAAQGIDPTLAETTRTVVLQHHVQSLLDLTKNLPPEREDMWWLVMLYDDTARPTKPCWSLDLPGGKRHLGETAIEGAIRETEEETSLVCSADWIRLHLQSTHANDPGNRHFLLTPPAELAEYEGTE